MLEVGDWTIRSVINGHVRLDGGAMFGVVPKVLWAKTQDTDDQNRILMAMRTLLAVNRKAGRIMLVDTGAGSKWSASSADRYAIENNPTAIEAALFELDATPDDVTDVVVTHLHFDHGGGMTRWVDEQGGDVEPVYANARHWIHQRQLIHAKNPTRRDRASYIAIDYEELEHRGLLTCVEGDAPASMIPGVDWLVSYGHTPGQILPWFRDPAGDRDLLFVGDITPTADHLPATWVMAYDLYPVTTMTERERVLATCEREGLLLAFPHDRSRGIVSITFDQRQRPMVDQILDATDENRILP